MFNKIFKTIYHKISFEDIQFAIAKPSDFIIINTLPTTKQHCLIESTISYEKEEDIVNDLLNNYDFDSKKFIIYGENANDETVDTKYNQIVALGFVHVYLYRGGLFEWLTLQDVYGSDEFPTTRKFLDILQYKPKRTFVS